MSQSFDWSRTSGALITSLGACLVFAAMRPFGFVPSVSWLLFVLVSHLAMGLLPVVVNLATGRGEPLDKFLLAILVFVIVMLGSYPFLSNQNAASEPGPPPPSSPTMQPATQSAAVVGVPCLPGVEQRLDELLMLLDAQLSRDEVELLSLRFLGKPADELGATKFERLTVIVTRLDDFNPSRIQELLAWLQEYRPDLCASTP